MSKFETPGMRRKERVLDGKAARTVTIKTVLAKAAMAGFGTSDGRDGRQAFFTRRISTEGSIDVHLTQFEDYVFADALIPLHRTIRKRLHTIPDVQELIHEIGSISTAGSTGGSTQQKEGSRP